MLGFSRENSKQNFWEIGFYGNKHKINNSYAFLKAPFTGSYEFIDRGATKQLEIQAQFKYNYRIFKETSGRWKPYIGWAVNPYWSEFNFTSHQPYLLSQKKAEYGISAGFIPRLQFNWTSRLTVDFNACMYLITQSLEHSYINNTALTERQNTTDTFVGDILQKYSLRVGLSYQLGKPKNEN